MKFRMAPNGRLGSEEALPLAALGGKTIRESEAGLQRKTRSGVASIQKTINPGRASAPEKAPGRWEESSKKNKNPFRQNKKAKKTADDKKLVSSTEVQQRCEIPNLVRKTQNGSGAAGLLVSGRTTQRKRFANWMSHE